MVTDEELISGALQARTFAYAPYSRFAVGAVVVGGSGKVYAGCNVENASFSHTCCAERTAVFKAVSEGETKVVRVAIVTDTHPPASPCGSCRQVIHEFGPDAVVICANLSGDSFVMTMSELLPAGFNPQVVLDAIHGR